MLWKLSKSTFVNYIYFLKGVYTLPLIKTVLADDNRDSLEIIETILKRHQKFRIVATCTDGEELINQVVKCRPDLVITDIKMPKLNGIEVIKKCRKFDSNVNFIFVTGFDDFAVEAFNVAAIDYIVKPFNMDRFFAALEKAIEIIQHKQQLKSKSFRSKLKIKSSGSNYYIPMEDIYFIEKQGKKCIIHGKNKLYETNESIKVLYQKLNDTFYLSHRSYIINLKKILNISASNETYLAHFEGIPDHAHISKLKIKEIETIIQYL
ncbi:response regulator of the LytR/AlgR family [Schinkia azotoformans MEV2011]|uniref:Response regulator of the LytR/AlgR family n=1 Tax=Schinkia azotoformans MEV2011 TaxID=1348973 RepID=A0A072NRA7_SCHAZ|nr:response regulator of the LytR/AlgR family [Schinkia azotoformans MEV2011]